MPKTESDLILTLAMSESEPESNPSSSTTTETSSEPADFNSAATPGAKLDLNSTNLGLAEPVISTTSEPTEIFTRPRGPSRGSGRGTGGGNTLRSPLVGGSAVPIPPSLQAKLAAMASRGSRPPATPVPTGFGIENGLNNVALSGHTVSRVPPGMSASAKRPRAGLTLGGIVGNSTHTSGGGVGGAGVGAGRPPLDRRPQPSGTPFSNFRSIVDPSGALNFGGKAVLHASGVDFSNGSSFAINMGEFRLDEELGRGNYGAVKKVLHKPTNVVMAMKEIRVELDGGKLNAIIMELDILHRAVAPEILEFYGAFFIESCVYYCMEYMDAGSLEQLQHDGIVEPVLARITQSMVRGLKFLKDELQVMHRDVKPTNVLVNRKGEVKLCDFGVSGQLERSLAKTNIGCQSYMAPERIHGESQNNLGTYTVSSDVWSLGLSIVELAMGKYPYPPETYSNVFAQLTAIVHGPSPALPDGFSPSAVSFVEACLVKEPPKRATYAELLDHSFLVEDRSREVDMVGWVASAIAPREARPVTTPVSQSNPTIPAVSENQN